MLARTVIDLAHLWKGESFTYDSPHCATEVLDRIAALCFRLPRNAHASCVIKGHEFRLKPYSLFSALDYGFEMTGDVSSAVHASRITATLRMSLLARLILGIWLGGLAGIAAIGLIITFFRILIEDPAMRGWELFSIALVALGPLVVITPWLCVVMLQMPSIRRRLNALKQIIQEAAA